MQTKKAKGYCVFYANYDDWCTVSSTYGLRKLFHVCYINVKS